MKLACARFALCLVLLVLCGMSHAATFTVTNTGDNGGVNPARGTGTGTLRQAIVDADNASGSSTITFATSAHGTITLTRALPDLVGNFTVQGPGAKVLTVSGDKKVRVFKINSYGRIEIAGLTIADGNAAGTDSYGNIIGGGGIFNDHSTLTLTNCVLFGNQRGGVENDGSGGGSSTVTANGCSFFQNSGSGIYNYAAYNTANTGASSSLATLSLSNCTFAHNTAVDGGGVDNNGAFGATKLMLTGCIFFQNSAQGSGGGLYNNTLADIGATATLSHCSFVQNSAGSGGGLSNYGFVSEIEVSLTDCSFTNNTAGVGGGIYSEMSHGKVGVRLTRCALVHNTASSAGGGIACVGGVGGRTNVTASQCVFSQNFGDEGGGLYSFAEDGEATVVLDDCRFTSNSATTQGGGFSVAADTVQSVGEVKATLSNCSFNRNSAASGGGFAIGDGYYGSAIVRATNCAFIHNSAQQGGGFFNAGDSSGGSAGNIITLINSTLAQNAATNGGGFYNTDQTTVVNSTLSQNSAEATGGGFYNAGDVEVLNSTLFHNTAKASGGGCQNGGSAGLRNCTFAQNAANQGSSLYNSSTIYVANSIFNSASGDNLANNKGDISSHGYNLSSDAAGGDAGTGPGGLLNGLGDIRNTDPQLDPQGARNNGGPTPTIALQSGSPAINAGNPQFKATTTPYDQRGPGFARVAGGRLDIGAFEVQSPVMPDQLSSATASVATQSVTLRFNTALAADSAGDAAHYTVEVNGRAAPVESATYNVRNLGVALYLAPGTLHHGAKVTVRWSGLQDSHGRPVTGPTETLVAR